jgi:biopolymer transport protein ExbB/TolQ
MDDWDDFDAEPNFWSGSELERMVSACEQATDGFVRAVDAKSEAEAAFLRVFHTARAHAARSAKSEAASERQAEDASVEEKIAFRRAVDALESAKALRYTRMAVLSAAQSHLRSVVGQT